MKLRPYDPNTKTQLFGVEAERTKELLNASIDQLKIDFPKSYSTADFAGVIVGQCKNINEVAACLTYLPKAIRDMQIQKLEEMGNEAVESARKVTDEVTAGVDKAMDILCSALSAWAKQPSEKEKPTSDTAPVDGKGE